jgi:hypothetical protein
MRDGFSLEVYGKVTPPFGATPRERISPDVHWQNDLSEI